MRMVRALAAKGSRLATEYRLDLGKTVIYKPDGGQLEVITSSAAAAEGAEITVRCRRRDRALDARAWRPGAIRGAGPEPGEVGFPDDGDL
jgi:hypothetical protein